MRTVLSIAIIAAIISGCTPPTVKPNADATQNPGVISEDYLFGLSDVAHAYGDIDHDGTPEWFLQKAATFGVAERNPVYLVLKRDGQYWRPMGEIGGPLRILPLGPDGGIRLMGYYCMGSGESVIETLTYRNGKFVCINSETVQDGDSGTDEGRRRSEELFSDTSPGEPLRSSMYGEALP